MAQFILPEQFLRSFKPDRFNGRLRSANAEEWFSGFERYCSAAGMVFNDPNRVGMAGLLLTNDASRWYEQVLPQCLASPEPYLAFRQRFHTRFVGDQDSRDAFDHLMSLCMKEGHATTYNNTFQRLAARVEHFDAFQAVRQWKYGT